jgi:tetratricopeptide (TPR) repeat protein
VLDNSTSRHTSDIEQFAEHIKAHVVSPANAPGGRSAAEHHRRAALPLPTPTGPIGNPPSAVDHRGMLSIPWVGFRSEDIVELIATLLLRTVDGAERTDGSASEVVAGDQVFEIRSFCEPLTSEQRQQVVESLRATVSRRPNLAAWALVLPLDASPSEDRWLREVLTAQTTATVSWMGRTALETALAELQPEPGGIRNTIVGANAQVVVQGGVIAGNVHVPVTVHRALPGIVARQLPPPVEIVGREPDLAILLEVLHPESASGAAAVAGMPGVGKTALAVAAGHTAVDQGWFPGGDLFVDLRGYDVVPVGADRALDSLLRGLGVPGEEIPPETVDRVGLYRSVLAGAAGPVLVILDNASAAEQVRPLLPGDTRHRVLITSRHSLPQLGVRHRELAVLSVGDSVSVLNAAVRAANPVDARIAADLPASNRVASHCGQLPLALQIAAALLAFEPTMPVAELAEELAEAHTRLEHLDDGERAVRAAFDLSYHRLPADQARLFWLLGVHPGPDVATGTVAVLADRDERRTRGMLAELARAHLIEPAAVRGRWRMHDLIRIYAEQAAGHPAQAKEQVRARDRLCAHLLCLADAADDHLKTLPGKPVPAEFAGREDALAWFDAERSALVAVTSMAVEHGRDDIAHHLPARLVEYFMWRHFLDDWLTTAVISREAAARLGEPELEATALINYGNALRLLRRFDEAADACRTAHAIARAIGDRGAAAAALVILGVALRNTGHVEEAVHVCEQAVNALRRLGHRRGELHALNNLGNALLEAGRFEEAEVVHRKHLELSRRLGDRVGETMAMVGLGNLRYRSGDVRTSAEVFEGALVIARETGNAELQSTLLNNHGQSLRDLGQAQQALALHQRDLELCRENHDAPGEARALIGIAAALAGTGNSTEAQATCRKAAEIARTAGHDELEANAQATLSNIVFAQELWSEAITVSQRAAELYRHLGEPAKEAGAHFNLGSALAAENRHQEAVGAYDKAARLHRATGDRRAEAQTLLLRAGSFITTRRLHQAQRDYSRAQTIAHKARDRFIEGRALVGLGGALLLAGRSAEAIPVLRRAAEIARQNGDSTLASLALCQLGAALFDIGRGDETFPLLDEAVQLNPDLDPLDALAIGTLGKVRSFSTYLPEQPMPPRSEEPAERSPARQARRKRANKSRTKHRR